MLSVLSVQRVLLGALDRLLCFGRSVFIATLARCIIPGFSGYLILGLDVLPEFLFLSTALSRKSTLACGLKLKTLSRLHKYTQANRAYCFTVARMHLVLRARIVSLYPSVRALTSTARTGINSLIQWAMVPEAGIEPARP